MLIKLRQGRGQANEKVGEKHIEMTQIPSKQRSNQQPIAGNTKNEAEYLNKVNQKAVMDDDIDDIILDPESPIRTASPSDFS